MQSPYDKLFEKLERGCRRIDGTVDIYALRRSLIEDPAFGLAYVQGRCYLTNASAARCTAHELFVQRGERMGAEQWRIFHPYNMVLVEAKLHDQGISSYQRWTLGIAKIADFGHAEIEAYLESLELVTWHGLNRWLEAMKS